MIHKLLSVIAIGTLLVGCDSLRRHHRIDPWIITQHSSSGTGATNTHQEGPRNGDELWIIAKPTPPISAESPSSAEARGLPYVRWSKPDGAEGATLSSAHTDLHAVVEGPAATVTIRQQYRNAFDHSVDLEYVFPLPADAAVSDFVMTIGARHIRAIIRERAEAQRLYAEVRGMGHAAALLTEQETGSFKQALANLAPGQQVEITTTYFQTLGYPDAECELRLPLDRGAHEAESHALSLAVDIYAGMDLESIRSPSHAITVQRPSVDRAHVELQSDDNSLEPNFVLRYRTAGDGLKSAWLAHHDQRGGFFVLLLQPPADGEQAKLTEVAIDWGALAVSDVNPAPIPAVSADNPLVLTGRFQTAEPTIIRITGKSGAEQQSTSVTVSAADLAESHPGLVSLWARAQLAGLTRESAGGTGASAERTTTATNMALDYGLLSPHTGILAVDASAPAAAAPQ